ncbi:MAG: VanW family protein [Clostridia bacterium]|nr:VanW family protein [Clostridia bacterium]
MKKVFIIFLLFFPIIILTGCNNSNNANTTNQANIEISRTGTISNDTSLNILVNNTSNTQPVENNTINNTTQNNNVITNNTIQENQPTTNTESILYEFSTPIKSKSSNRLNNIKITCSKLNGIVVKPQEEFSFCKTIGKSTEDKGYKKADVIINKEITQALGGGNCQVSSTLYNAVLGIPSLNVTERHPHGKDVNYVPEGKDAAISYGSKDLKFINNSKDSIKIYANADNGKVYVKIVALK